MNKKLYIEKIETEKLLNEKYHDIYQIATFIREYEKCFKKKESIEALKRIKEYLKNEMIKYEKIENEYNKIYFEFQDNCEHEIAVSDSDINNCKCIICNYDLYSNEERQKPKIIMDASTNIELLKNRLDEIIYSDKDPIEEIFDYASEANIKIYRR